MFDKYYYLHNLIDEYFREQQLTAVSVRTYAYME